MKRFNKNDKLLVRLFLISLAVLAAMHPAGAGQVVAGAARIVAAVLEAAADNTGAALTLAAIGVGYVQLRKLAHRIPATATAH